MAAFNTQLLSISVLVYVVAWFAFRSRAFCVAVDIGLFKSLVLSTLPHWNVSLESPPTIPEDVGLISGASRSSWSCRLLKLSSTSVLVYVVDWFAFNNKSF